MGKEVEKHVNIMPLTMITSYQGLFYLLRPAEKDGGKGINIEEILAFHKQQKQSIERAEDIDKIVIRSLKEGYRDDIN